MFLRNIPPLNTGADTVPKVTLIMQAGTNIRTFMDLSNINAKFAEKDFSSKKI